MKENVILVRKMDVEDISKVKDLEINSYLSPWSKEDYIENLKNINSISLVAELDSESSKNIVGFIIARLITTVFNENRSSSNICEIEIYNLAVNSVYQRQGIGTKLLNECEKYCVSSEKLQIWLEVRASNNSAIEFYKKFGFAEKYRRRLFYVNPPEDAVVMNLEK